MTAQPKPTAVEEAARIISAEVNHRAFITYNDAEDIARLLAAAGLLATAEPVVIEVHHHDIEKHATSFNEGYEAAVAQRLADDPTLAADWLAEHDAQVAAQALHNAAAAYRAGDTAVRDGQGDVRHVPVDWWLDHRGHRIAAGEQP